MIERSIADLIKSVPRDIAEFIYKIDETTKNGKYRLSGGCYVNIEEYTTKPIAEAIYESHNRYIDIQIILNGKENIYIKQKRELKDSCGYNEEKDIEFYNDSIDKSSFVTLDGSNYVKIMPEDAHAPQVAIFDNTEPVRKAVIKIPI